MLIDTDHLVNQIHAKVEGVAETGFPMDVFPEHIQRIIYDLVTYENFNLEYTASIILSAYATAIGNTYHVKIKGNWISSCALFMILVGRPGLGKTPPLGFLYQPIRENDRQLLAKAYKEYELYEQQQSVKKDGEVKEPMEKPRLVQTVISDFTPEAMLSIHYDNPRGIVLLVDEVVALFNSVKRYSAKSNLIEDLLSAYSGQPIKAVRKTEAFPMSITRPCINLIGGVQTNILDEIFVLPIDRHLPIVVIPRSALILKKTMTGASLLAVILEGFRIVDSLSFDKGLEVLQGRCKVRVKIRRSRKERRIVGESRGKRRSSIAIAVLLHDLDIAGSDIAIVGLDTGIELIGIGRSRVEVTGEIRSIGFIACSWDRVKSDFPSRSIRSRFVLTSRVALIVGVTDLNIGRIIDGSLGAIEKRSVLYREVVSFA